MQWQGQDPDAALWPPSPHLCALLTTFPGDSEQHLDLLHPGAELGLFAGKAMSRVMKGRELHPRESWIWPIRSGDYVALPPNSTDHLGIGHPACSHEPLSAKVWELSLVPRVGVLWAVEMPTSCHTMLARTVSISGACEFPAKALGPSHIHVRVSPPTQRLGLRFPSTPRYQVRHIWSECQSKSHPDFTVLQNIFTNTIIQS